MAFPDPADSLSSHRSKKTRYPVVSEDHHLRPLCKASDWAVLVIMPTEGLSATLVAFLHWVSRQWKPANKGPCVPC